jgi:hypothetical protein
VHAAEPVAVDTRLATGPTRVTDVAAVAHRKSASLTWVKGDDGGSALTGQTVTIYSGTRKVGSRCPPPRRPPR